MFFSKVSYTWEAMGACWEVLKENKNLLLFPLFSGIACFVILASFAIPIILTDAWRFPGGEEDPLMQVAYYGTLFLFYFCNYFVITFFNAAIIGAAIQHLRGREATFGSAMKAATIRLPQILGWALVSATVGLILRAIEERSEWVGQIVAGILGAVWTMTTFLVVPVLVVEGKGPIEAFGRSASLLKKTWGEQIIGNFSFGLIFLLLAIPGFIVFAIGIALGGAIGAIVAITAAVVYLIVLSLVQSALQSIFQAVLYVYARKGKAPRGFSREMLGEAAGPAPL